MNENTVEEKLGARGACAVERILVAEDLAAGMDALAEGHRSRFDAVLAALGEE